MDYFWLMIGVAACFFLYPLFLLMVFYFRIRDKLYKILDEDKQNQIRFHTTWASTKSSMSDSIEDELEEILRSLHTIQKNTEDLSLRITILEVRVQERAPMVSQISQKSNRAR